MNSSPIHEALQHLTSKPSRPLLAIDERRLGPPEGFESEVVLFAGVRTSVRDALRFSARVQRARAALDRQKRSRALKASDVLRGRLSSQLGEASAELLSWSSVEFWASTTAHLLSVKSTRLHPAAEVVKGPAKGRRIDGQETPVIEMMAGLVADELRASELDVFVDRSKQNGLHEKSEDEFWIWDRLSTTSALRAGRPVQLAANSKIRFWAVSERTKLFGDVVLIADLCAHLWGLDEGACDRLRNSQIISHGIERIVNGPGLLIARLLRDHLRR